MHGSRYVVLALPRPDAITATENMSHDLGWILIASNNRVLGRSATTFDTLEQCLASIEHLRHVHGDATAASALSGQTHRWAWRLERDGASVAVCGRLFFRHTDCLYNLRRFLDAVPVSPLADDIRIVRGGRR